MSGRRSGCVEVTDFCTVERTTYGYAPNLGANATLLALFAICAILQVGFSTYHRAWSFLIALGGGCITEAVGYGGRIMMHANVWDPQAFRIQICCLILAPSFIAAGIYLSLKHIILYVGPEASRLKPRLYTWIFIGCDIGSIVVQAIGGGIASAATGGRRETNRSLLNLGNNLMIAGIAIQIMTMAICGVLALDYLIAYKRRGNVGSTSSYQSAKLAGQAPPINHTRFQVFVVVECLAYVFVLIRCIYRLPEMAGGWGNELMRNEVEFVVLDGMMIVLASIAFTIFHPGFWFPPMTGRWQNMRKNMESHETSLSDSDHSKTEK